MRRRCYRLEGYKQTKLLESFVAGVPAKTAAELADVNHHFATLFYQKIREMIACEIEDESPFYGEVEVDESHFGDHSKGNRGAERQQKYRFSVY